MQVTTHKQPGIHPNTWTRNRKMDDRTGNAAAIINIAEHINCPPHQLRLEKQKECSATYVAGLLALICK